MKLGDHLRNRDTSHLCVPPIKVRSSLMLPTTESEVQIPAEWPVGLVFANWVVGLCACRCGWQHGGMLISFAYRLTRKILGAVATVARRDVSSEAELLVLRHENTVLRRHVKKVCYRTQDRLWFAALSALIPRRRWAEVFPVTPGTMLTWHRKLAAGKYSTTPYRSGRRPTDERVRTLVIRMATENPLWGHRRVHGELARLGHTIAVSTVWGILHDAGIDPAPRRSSPTWRQFLTTQAHAILAVDFVRVDTVLLKRIYALILIEHGTRRPPRLPATC